MPVLPCCVGCQGNLCSPCGPCSGRVVPPDPCLGPCCPHAFGTDCSAPYSCPGVLHGYRGGVAGSYFSCGHGCIGGCIGGVGSSCCGPACN